MKTHTHHTPYWSCLTVSALYFRITNHYFNGIFYIEFEDLALADIWIILQCGCILHIWGTVEIVSRIYGYCSGYTCNGPSLILESFGDAYILFSRTRSPVAPLPWQLRWESTSGLYIVPWPGASLNSALPCDPWHWNVQDALLISRVHNYHSRLSMYCGPVWHGIDTKRHRHRQNTD